MAASFSRFRLPGSLLEGSSSSGDSKRIKGPIDAKTDYEQGLDAFSKLKDPTSPNFDYTCFLAYSLFLRAANNEHAKACSKLGVLFMKGLGVEKNLSEAYLWFTKATEKDPLDPVAFFYLAILDLHFFDLSKDEKHIRKAEKNIEKAKIHTIAQSDGEAAYLFALYFNDKNKPCDKIFWMNKSAEYGYAEAQYTLGVWYWNGNDNIKKDEKTALKWLKEASSQNHKEAHYFLGSIYEYIPEPNPIIQGTIRKLFMHAAEQGHAGAQFKYATILLQEECKETFETAMHFLRSSAEQNNPNALFALAKLYHLNNTFISPDFVWAKFLYEKFLDLYPQDELAGAVHFYLSELLKKDKTSFQDFKKADDYLNEAIKAKYPDACYVKALHFLKITTIAPELMRGKQAIQDAARLLHIAAKGDHLESQMELGQLLLLNAQHLEADTILSLKENNIDLDLSEYGVELLLNAAYNHLLPACLFLKTHLPPLRIQDKLKRYQQCVYIAATLGDLESLYDMIVILFENLYFDKTLTDDLRMKQAVLFCEQAAERNHPQAQLKLAYYYFKKGTSKDLENFYFWLMRAAHNGVAEAQYRLGYDLLANDTVSAIHWLGKASDQGHSEATSALWKAGTSNLSEALLQEVYMGLNDEINRTVSRHKGTWPADKKNNQKIAFDLFMRNPDLQDRIMRSLTPENQEIMRNYYNNFFSDVFTLLVVNTKGLFNPPIISIILSLIIDNQTRFTACLNYSLEMRNPERILMQIVDAIKTRFSKSSYPAARKIMDESKALETITTHARLSEIVFKIDKSVEEARKIMGPASIFVSVRYPAQIAFIKECHGILKMFPPEMLSAIRENNQRKLGLRAA